MKIFDNIKEKIQDFIDENKRLAMILLVSVLLILILLVLLIVGSSSAKSKKAPLKAVTSGTEVFEDPFIPPQDAGLSNDYYFSRNTEKKWTDEEAESYFTVPTPSVIDELRKDNDSLVEDILGAAP